MVEQIVANAELAVSRFQELTEFEFGYDRQSVEWVDGFINRQRAREDYTEEFGRSLANKLGCFLGQCIVECFGGSWKSTEGGWAVSFDEQNETYPFNKTLKQFENGPEDSIVAFFDAVPVLFNRDS